MQLKFKQIMAKRRVATSVVSALILGTVVTISTPTQVLALAPVGSANGDVTSSGGLPTSLGLATINIATSGDSSASAVAVTSKSATASARSIGLVAANLTSATLTATVRPSGALTLYVLTSTTVAFSASNGSIGNIVTPHTATITSANNASGSATAVALTLAATAVADTMSVTWTAPSTEGTYYIYARSAAHSTGSGVTVPTVAVPTQGSTIGGVTVTVATNTTHPSAGGTNSVDISGATNTSLFTAVSAATGTTGVTHPTTTIGVGEATAKSKGLLSKDSTIGTAQSATLLAGGVLSLYAPVNTATAFSATGGTFSDSVGMGGNATVTYSSSNRVTVLNGMTPVTGTTSVATLWTAPTTAGTYTISLLTGFPQDSNASTYSAPTTSALPPTLGGKITVTVVAASAGGSYSAAYSACNTAPYTLTESAGSYPSGVDSSATVADGGVWFIDFNLNDAYNANLSSGNIVATATNGALINIGTDAGATPVAGTASTDTNFSNGEDHTVIISQPTAGAPLTTTVTISYNGTTVCTKTVTIRGKVASLEVANVGVQALSGTGGSTAWIQQNAGDITGLPAGLFTVVAKDSAGNIVSTPSTLGSYGSVASTLTTTVQAIVVGTRSTSASSTSANRFNVGTWYCGDTAGSANVKLKFTITATGDVIESPAFTARCADSAYTYKASFDKATYNQGDTATLTVQYLDSKGNKSNTISAPGASTFTLPMLTSVDYASSATAVTKADGTNVFKFTVGGTDTAFTAGTYTGVINYSSLTAQVPATVTYTLKTATTDVAFNEILKSVVALIASINKQIQALQKLILNRKR